MRVRKILAATLALFLAVPVASAADTDADFQKKMDSFLSEDANIEKLAKALERFVMKKKQADEAQARQDEEQRLSQQFKNPISVELGNSPSVGPADAKVVVVEFSDFQCPFCQRGAQVVEQLRQKYPKDLRVVFKHLPLPFHDQARPAAIASLAAGAQGKFWEMHDELFKNQHRLNTDTFVELAKKIGIDADKFKKDLQDEKFAKQVEADMQLAQKLDVEGTPNFFVGKISAPGVVGGINVRGARPLDYFDQKVIQPLLK
jgi:protein-disulfide isomerase